MMTVLLGFRWRRVLLEVLLEVPELLLEGRPVVVAFEAHPVEVCLHRIVHVVVPIDHVDCRLCLGEEGVNILGDAGKKCDQLSSLFELRSIFQSDDLDQLGMCKLHPVGDHEVAQGDAVHVPVGSGGHPRGCDPKVGSSAS